MKRRTVFKLLGGVLLAPKVPLGPAVVSKEIAYTAAEKTFTDPLARLCKVAVRWTYSDGTQCGRMLLGTARPGVREALLQLAEELEPPV